MLSYNEIKHKKILISPLDWGFGHTTRCVSIVRTLLRNNNSIIFAGNQKQCEFFASEFDNVKTVDLQGYNIRLNSKRSTYLQIAVQIPKFFLSKLREYYWLKRFIKTNPVDLIISDNRYGFYSRVIPSILITHQTNPKIPFGQKWISTKIQSWINRFNTCWIPDDKTIALSGELSQHKLKIPVDYIGLLSRFTFQKETQKLYDFLFIISGPQPESARFLNQIVTLANQNNSDHICIVSNNKYSSHNNQNITFIQSPDTHSLELLINQSREIISRCGYTSLMELFDILDQSILIPTKGQYEQIYLSKLHQTVPLQHSNKMIQKLLEI